MKGQTCKHQKQMQMKKNMKRTAGTFTAIMVLLLSASVLQAQARQRDGYRGQVPDSAGVSERVDEMAKDLNLSESQKAKVLQLEQDHFRKVRAERYEASGMRTEHQRNMEALRNAHYDQMKKVLTEDQFLKWEEQHQQRMRERKHDGSGRGQGPGYRPGGRPGGGPR